MVSDLRFRVARVALAALAAVGSTGICPARAADSDVRILLSSQVIADRIGSTNPNALPGAIIEYRAEVTNSGPNAVTSDSLSITNAVPRSLRLVLREPNGPDSLPFTFVEGQQPSTLACPFRSIADPEDCVEFSNDGGASFDYRPTPDNNGIDPAITNFRFRLRGAMAPAGSEPSQFTLLYRMKVD